MKLPENIEKEELLREWQKDCGISEEDYIRVKEFLINLARIDAENFIRQMELKKKAA